MTFDELIKFHDQIDWQWNLVEKTVYPIPVNQTELNEWKDQNSRCCRAATWPWGI